MRGREYFVVLMAGIVLLGKSVHAQDTEPVPAQCQPCGQSGQHVQCPGLQCPLYYQVTDPSASGVQCQLPGTTTTTTTAATDDANTTATAAVGERENATSVADSVTTLTTTTTPATPATTDAPTPDSNQTITLVSSPATTTNTSNQPRPPPPSATTTICKICLENCRVCNGSNANDCLECRKDHELEDAGGRRIQCVASRKKKDDSKPDIIIIAASAGGGALLLLVVVVVACVCCRRCRRRAKMDREQGLGMVAMNDILSSSEQGEKGEPSKTEEVQIRPNKPGLDIPDYVNVTSTMPRPVSIERGHDKVTRYVRDPTVKMATGRDQKPEPVLGSPTEEQELADLPPAPVPPPGGRKRSTDVGDPRATHPTAVRSHTTLPATADISKADRHHRRTGPAGASSLPSSSLPKFPMEEELEKHRRAPGSTAKVEEEEEEEPEESYENLGHKARLREPADGERRTAGVHNLGLDVEDEPEDEYVNQAAVQEALNEDQHPYQNLPPRGHR